MTEKVKKQDYKLRAKLEELANKYTEVVPWEGTFFENKPFIEELMELLDSKKYSLLRHTKNG